jgi:hypothetical protein
MLEHEGIRSRYPAAYRVVDIGADNQMRNAADPRPQDLRNPSSTPAVMARTDLSQVGAGRRQVGTIVRDPPGVIALDTGGMAAAAGIDRTLIDELGICRSLESPTQARPAHGCAGGSESRTTLLAAPGLALLDGDNVARSGSHGANVQSCQRRESLCSR